DEPDRFHVEGPEITIGPKAVISISLMLHEMVTNAIKHGALSVEMGRVDIVWNIEGTGEGATLHMRWTERGGPPAQKPTRHGFGSRLINGGLTGAGRVK